jgi:hypothetical protein
MIDYPENFDLILDGIRNGKYNLFLGAGVSLDSKDRNDNYLPSGNKLKTELCRLKNINGDITLSRIMNSLSSSEIDKYITKVFSNTKPGSTLLDLPNYVWKRVFTFNVDDVVENIYKLRKDRKQEIVISNYSDTFFFTEERSNVQIIHLHGYANMPEAGYVFNVNEYMNNIKNNNTWMRVLADIVATDSFIISGISFNEPDFDYYASFRSIISPRKDLYPTLLVEPFPDSLLEQDCKEKGINLIKSKFSDFMEIVKHELPNPPSIFDMTIRSNNNFSDSIPKNLLMRFFSEFEAIDFGDAVTNKKVSPFDYGYDPSYHDIIVHKDIQRKINTRIYSELLAKMQDTENYLILITGLFYNGKSTSVMRCLNDLSVAGKTIYKLKSLSGFSGESTLQSLKYTNTKTILYFDNLAEYINQVTELLEKCNNTIVIGTERQYRVEHVKKVFADKITTIDCNLLYDEEIRQLIEKYRIMGVVTNTKILSNIDGYIASNRKLTIGEHVCNILQDFTPIEQKLPALLSYYKNTEDIKALIIMSLGYFCFASGINYSIVQALLSPHYDLWFHFKGDVPFLFCFNKENNDYIIPQNKLLSDKLLQYLLRNRTTMVQDIYKSILIQLSYYVNRMNIIRRTPESKLASKMLDIDKTLFHFFDEKTGQLLLDIEKEWGWNSRYWEQRALYYIDIDIDMAIKHAKQAVSIENHQFPLTTLGKLLFKKMEKCKDEEMIRYFKEGATHILDAMILEDRRNSITIHPFMALVNGCIAFARFNESNVISKNLLDRIKMGLLTFEDEIRLNQTEKKRFEEVLSWL